MRIFAKTMRDLRQGLIGWGIGVVGLTAVMLAVWPSIRDMPGWEQLLEAYPAPMRELFDIESMTTGAGFLNAELFTLMIPLLNMGMSTVDIATATVAVTLLGVEHGCSPWRSARPRGGGRSRSG